MLDLLNKKVIGVAIVLCTIATLALGQNKFNPNKKIALADLQYDFTFLQKALIEGHPGIYRYQTPESMDAWFKKYYSALTDSLTEPQYRILLTNLIEKIHCGHTVIYPSKKYKKWTKRQKPKLLPLTVFVKKDSLFIQKDLTADSSIKLRSRIISINGHSAKNIVDSLVSFVTTDGYNTTHKYNVVNRKFDRYYYFLIDKADSFDVTYKFQDKTYHKKLYALKRNNSKEKKVKSKNQQSFISNDTSAILKLDAFNGLYQRYFLKRIFKKLHQKQTPNLIIDLRNNGGGRVRTATRLLNYIVDTAIVLESVKSTSKLSFRKKLSSHRSLAVVDFFLKFTPHHIKNGYRYTYFQYKVKNRNHYNGNVYLLINGGSFSASSIVSSYLKYYKKVTVIGEETGGAMNGCNALFLPNLKLPKTKLEVRFPLYQINHLVKSDTFGRGIMPDYSIAPDLFSTKDVELEKAYQLIQQNKK